MNRSSGILLPVSALPGPCGIGDLGADARDFIDFLAAAGQRYWQILPLNPPDGAHSPYLSASTFAGSTDLLSPEPFLARGALTAGEVRAIDWGADPMRVDYDRVYAGRTALWDAAFAREKASAAPALRAALAAEPWLRDYCLYMAVKEEQGGAPWYAWPQPLRVQIMAHLARIRARAADINSPDKLQRKGQAAQGGQQGDCPRNQARPLGKTARIAARRQGRAGKAQALQKPGHPLLIAAFIIKAKRFCILPPHIIKLNAGSLQLFQQPLRAQPLAGYALQQRPHGVNSKRRI